MVSFSLSLSLSFSLARMNFFSKLSTKKANSFSFSLSTLREEPPTPSSAAPPPP